MVTRLTVPMIAVLALVVFAACSESPKSSLDAPIEGSAPAASATPTPVPSPAPTATVEPVTGSEDTDSLPQFVQILSPEYHEAYRLLPDGPWARESISRQFQDFDLDEWQQLDWEEGSEVAFNYELNAWTEIQWKRLLQDAEGDPVVEKWLVERVRQLDPEIGRQFESVKSVSDRVELVRRLIEVEGLYIDVRVILIEWEGRQVGHSDELIALIVEDVRKMTEISHAWWSLGEKAQVVHGFEIDLCVLLMNTVAGQSHRSVITDGNCEITKAIEIAQEYLAANGGQPALTETDFRGAIEFNEAVESGEYNRNREKYVNPNPDDDEDDNYDG